MPSIDELEAQFKAAQAAVEAYSEEITAKYRELHPAEVDEKGKPLPPTPELLVKRARAWTDEESEELGRLRKAATAAALELRRARDAAKTDSAGQ